MQEEGTWKEALRKGQCARSGESMGVMTGKETGLGGRLRSCTVVDLTDEFQQ